MILQAEKAFQLDLPGSVLIGDKDSDIEAGLAAGVGYNILLNADTSGKRGTDMLHFATLVDITAWLDHTFPPCRGQS